MEVSSQALKLERTYGIMFDIGIFLNLGKDHISRFEHSDEAEYLECKRKLFSRVISGSETGMTKDMTLFSVILRAARSLMGYEAEDSGQRIFSRIRGSMEGRG